MLQEEEKMVMEIRKIHRNKYLIALWLILPWTFIS